MTIEHDIENMELIDSLNNLEGISVKNITNKWLYLDLIHNKIHSLDEVEDILLKYYFKFEITWVGIYDSYTRVHLSLEELENE